ncbi:MAG TPA: TRAP transporter small permease [Firmicutes bacterium]|nr:TRAP transporter small permease [Bacillota bacterium]
MKFLRKLNYYLYRFQGVFVVALFAIMLVLAVLQVVLRLFFRSGIEGADTMTRYLVLWVGFLGASLATYKHRHINIDIFGQFLRGAKKKAVKIIVNGAAFIVAFFLAFASFTYVRNEMYDTTTVFGIPIWVMVLVLPLSFGFMSLKFLQDFLEGVMQKKKKRANEEIGEGGRK